MIRYVRGEKREDMANITICAGHPDPGPSSIEQGGEHLTHRVVEDAITLKGAVALVEAVKLRNREISEKNHCAPRRLAPYILVNVADGEVNRPGLLITTEC